MILASGAPEGAGLFIPPLFEVIASVLCLLPIAWIVAKKAVPIYLRTLDERTEKIEGGLRRAAEAEEQIAVERAQWAQEIADARAQSGKARDEARAEAQAIVAEARAQASQEAERLLATAKAQIAAEAKAAEEDLRGHIGTLATQLAGQIVGEALEDQALATRVIDRFLDDLEASTVPAGSAGSRR
ncbi:MAG: F0F1 ATP synthase subunit B [Micrococcales bacterium]|nr:F0F1 ATP synthase subunit B [Micrococcales bacterium]